MSISLSRGGLLAAAVALLCAAPAQADPCASSTAGSQSFADPSGDGDAGLAPDIAQYVVTTGTACDLTVAYGMANRSSMIQDDFLGWYLDVDASDATGSTGGFRGADYAVGRLDDGFSALSRWNGSQFEVVKQVAASGAFGVTANINDLGLVSGRTIGFAGGAHWQGQYDTYFDFAPDAGLPEYAGAATFAAAAPPPPPPPPPPAPTPVPTEGTAAPAPDCVVPRLRGLRRAAIGARMRRARCRFRIRTVRSKRYHGRVVRTFPYAGDTLLPDEVVTVYVGRRPPRKRARAASADALRLERLLNAAAR